MKRRLLIDGDILAYKSATMAEVDTNWGEGLWTLHADENYAKSLLYTEIENLKENLETDIITIALTDSKNFRKDVLPSYKDNRKNKRKPLVLGALREHLKEEYNAIVLPNLEADDVLGILATKPNKGEQRIICSLDKDLMQIPSYISKDGKNIVLRKKNECDWWHLIQTLTGDSVDGFSGCPSVGIKTAEKILTDKSMSVKDMWQLVVKTYEKNNLTEADALQQAQVARILRHGEYNKTTGEINLWKI